MVPSMEFLQWKALLCLMLWYLCLGRGCAESNGYFYKPPIRRPEQLDKENLNETTTVLSSSSAGVQQDFIDDLIAEHKEQIVASILGNNQLQISPGGIESGDEKSIRFSKCATCTCGIPNVNRIVGGNKIRTNKYPWIVQMINEGIFFCGGSLINDRYVLTAAHCVSGMTARQITVRLLQYDRTSKAVGIERKVSFAHMHSQYNPTTLVHDIALLKLNLPVPLLDPIRPVCLPKSSNQNFDFKMSIVAGWGLTKEDGNTSDILREVVVPVITNAQCRATSYKSMIVETMLCAGYVQAGGKDACQGDSGGPLVVREGVFRLAGVVSYGYGCAKPDAPGVYTRVSKYLDWISANTRDACYCEK